MKTTFCNYLRYIKVSDLRFSVIDIPSASKLRFEFIGSRGYKTI
jgi:hypothetical protein